MNESSVYRQWLVFFLSSGVLCVYGDVSSNNVDRLFLSQGQSEGGYVYPVPPIQFEEPGYLPPLLFPPVFSDEVPFVPTPGTYLPPNNDIFPPQLPPTVVNDDTVLVPAQPPPTGNLYPPSQGLLPPQLRIENMSCTQGLNFRAVFKMANDRSHFPVVDDAAENCVSSLNGNTFKIDLESSGSMIKCGVRSCRTGGGRNGEEVNTNNPRGENMCVVVRIPTVRGVRLPEDGIVTLMCTPQERVVSQTRHVKLGSNKILQIARARSNNGFVATGGSQKDLKTKIGVFRKRPGSNAFDQNVQSDSVIQLGEELMLRATVNEGDGWRSSQIGPVLITGLNSRKSALLVNQQGCVNPAMRSICPKQPVKISPLSTELRFRAFLFQESPQGDEMVVSVRMQGCLHPQDCARSEPCADDSSTRTKRNLRKSNKSVNDQTENSLTEETKNWESQLSFKVEAIVNAQRKIIGDDTRSSDSKYFYLCVLALVGVVLGIIVIIFMLWFLYRRGKTF